MSNNNQSVFNYLKKLIYGEEETKNNKNNKNNYNVNKNINKVNNDNINMKKITNKDILLKNNQEFEFRIEFY
jgi:hypothetical protein